MKITKEWDSNTLRIIVVIQKPFKYMDGVVPF